MRLFKKTNIDFLGVRNRWYIVSTLTILIGMVGVIIKGVEFGVDFKGGTEIVVMFEKTVDVGSLRAALSKVGLGKIDLKSYGTGSSYLVRTTEQAELSALSKRISDGLQQSFPDVKFEVRKGTQIGPKIGKELRQDAIYAVLWAFIAILSYVAIRFKFT